MRPSADRVREALFDILLHRPLGPRPLEGAGVADLFAGTGAIGLEALSRRAAHLVAVENAAPALKALRANVARLGEEERVVILRADATRLPAPPAMIEYAFLDPPYGEALAEPALASLGTRGWLREGALVVVELASGETLAPPAGYEFVDERRYGRTRLVFLRWKGTAPGQRRPKRRSMSASLRTT